MSKRYTIKDRAGRKIGAETILASAIDLYRSHVPAPSAKDLSGGLDGVYKGADCVARYTADGEMDYPTSHGVDVWKKFQPVRASVQRGFDHYATTMQNFRETWAVARRAVGVKRLNGLRAAQGVLREASARLGVIDTALDAFEDQYPLATIHPGTFTGMKDFWYQLDEARDAVADFEKAVDKDLADFPGRASNPGCAVEPAAAVAALEPIARRLGCDVRTLAKAALPRRKPSTGPPKTKAAKVPGHLGAIQTETGAQITVATREIGADAALEIAAPVAAKRVEKPEASTVVVVDPRTGDFAVDAGRNVEALVERAKKLVPKGTVIVLEPLVTGDDARDAAFGKLLEEYAVDFASAPLTARQCEALVKRCAALHGERSAPVAARGGTPSPVPAPQHPAPRKFEVGDRVALEKDLSRMGEVVEVRRWNDDDPEEYVFKPDDFHVRAIVRANQLIPADEVPGLQARREEAWRAHEQTLVVRKQIVEKAFKTYDRISGSKLHLLTDGLQFRIAGLLVAILGHAKPGWKNEPLVDRDGTPSKVIKDLHWQVVRAIDSLRDYPGYVATLDENRLADYLLDAAAHSALYGDAVKWPSRARGAAPKQTVPAPGRPPTKRSLTAERTEPEKRPPSSRDAGIQAMRDAAAAPLDQGEIAALKALLEGG